MAENSRKLAGKTLFITGASRGIGKAIALKAAQDGANVVIAAKTSKPHPKLPGTIFTAAEEIEKAGGKCLPCQVDIRDEAQVQKAVEEAVKKFGGIDILINNASAISLTGTLDTPMKTYDLMHNINTRGTFLVSQKCIPYLKQAKNAHILNLGPPLRMNPVWFQGHVAYTMAKYGMSMCVLGMSEELRPYNIAVNSLWPRTAIWTAAMGLLAGDGGRKGSRKPEILADAAYVILTKDSKNATGNFYIDEEVLKEVGVKAFDKYAEVPGEPLMLDFFTEEAEKNMMNAISYSKTPAGKIPADSSGKQGEAGKADSASVTAIFDKLKTLLNPELVGKVKGMYQFDLKSPGSDTVVSWYLDLKNGKGECGQGAPPGGAADVTMTCESSKFVDMFGGKVKPTTAFMTGQLKIKGNMGLALKLEKLMGDFKSKL